MKYNIVRVFSFYQPKPEIKLIKLKTFKQLDNFQDILHILPPPKISYIRIW